MSHCLCSFFPWRVVVILITGLSLGVADVQPIPNPLPVPVAISVDVGGRKITFPAPEGFVRIDGVFKDWDDLQERSLPPSNRKLIDFGSPEDLASLKQGQYPDQSRGFNAQVLHNLQNVEIGSSTFARSRQEMKDELDGMKQKLETELTKVTDRVNQNVLDKTQIDVALKLSDVVVLDYFEDTESSLGFSLAMNASVKTSETSTEKMRIIVSTLMIPVNGRLLYLYSTNAYKSDVDRQWSETSLVGWGRSVVAANPVVAGPDTSISGGFNWPRVATMAAVGGIIGGLIALLKARQKNKAA